MTHRMKQKRHGAVFMLKRRIVRGGTLVLALLLANVATLSWKGKAPRSEEVEPAEDEVLLENVLAENAAMEDNFPYLYARGKISEKDLPEKVVFLTFDDGPSRNTVKILDTLAKYKVCATFFVIGENLTEEGLAIAKRALEEGHMLGMHTETHRYDKIYHSVEDFLADYDKLAARFVEAFGECPAIFRFPGGSYSSYINPIKEELRQELERRGFVGYDWTVSGEDSVGTPTAASIKKNVLEYIAGQKQPIILLHDSPCSNLTAEVLPEIIEELLARGYTFMTLQYRTPYQFPW